MDHDGDPPEAGVIPDPSHPEGYRRGTRDLPNTPIGGKERRHHHAPGARIVTARQRKADAAVQLRIQGATWSEIAIALGYPNPRNAMMSTEKALQRALATTEDRDILRKLAGARLDALLRTVWGKATDEEHPEHLIALSKAREVISDHRKLFGLDAPTEVVVHNPTQNEIEAWVAKVAAIGAPPIGEYDILDGEVISDDISDITGTPSSVTEPGDE